MLTEVGQPCGRVLRMEDQRRLSTTAGGQGRRDTTSPPLTTARPTISRQATCDLSTRPRHGINDDDRCVIGDPNPDIYGNIYTTLNWKNLTLRAVINYSLGNDIYNYQRSLLEGGYLFINQTTALRDRWTTENQVTSVPRVSYKDPLGNARFSDRWIEDGSLHPSQLCHSELLPAHHEHLSAGSHRLGQCQQPLYTHQILGWQP